MKKLILIAIISILAMQAATAQDNAEKKTYQNIFKFSVTNFFSNTFQASYERRICTNSALMLSAGILYKNNNSEKTEGIKTDLQYKYFVFTKEKNNGGIAIYFAPYILYSYTELRTNYIMDMWPYNYPQNYYYNSFSGGVLFGMGFTIAKKISIDAYLGGGIKRSFDNHFKDAYLYYSNSIWQPGYNGITPKGGIDVGFKF